MHWKKSYVRNRFGIHSFSKTNLGHTVQFLYKLKFVLAWQSQYFTRDDILPGHDHLVDIHTALAYASLSSRDKWLEILIMFLSWTQVSLFWLELMFPMHHISTKSMPLTILLYMKLTKTKLLHPTSHKSGMRDGFFCCCYSFQHSTMEAIWFCEAATMNFNI